MHEDLLYREDSLTSEENNMLFGRFSITSIEKIIEESGLYRVLHRKGYKKLTTELKIVSSYDQRIFIFSRGIDIVQIRLKLSKFSFKRHSELSARLLLFIDWLQTRDVQANRGEPRLFPGQDAPGLGVFSFITEIITRIANEVHAAGAFNLPEYFHDALLFHRRFRFYHPEKEAQFRLAIRDLRKYGARNISKAFASEAVLLNNKKPVPWVPGEMLSLTDHVLDSKIFSESYFKEIEEYIAKNTLSLDENATPGN